MFTSELFVELINVGPELKVKSLSFKSLKSSSMFVIVSVVFPSLINDIVY